MFIVAIDHTVLPDFAIWQLFKHFGRHKLGNLATFLSTFVAAKIKKQIKKENQNQTTQKEEKFDQKTFNIFCCVAIQLVGIRFSCTTELKIAHA